MHHHLYELLMEFVKLSNSHPLIDFTIGVHDINSHCNFQI